MSRRQRVWKKFHNKIRQIRKTSLLGVGVLCALAAALLAGGSVRAAVSVSGMLRIEDAEIDWDVEPDKTLVYWHEFQVTSKEFDLNNTYNNPNSSEDSETFNPDNPIEVSVGSYNSEEIFRPDISDPELNWSVTIDDNIERNPNNWRQSGTLAGLPITISYDDQGSRIAETTTYYRVFTEADETSSLETALSEY